MLAAMPTTPRRADAPEYATLTPDDLVTGEAVALDLPPAGLGTRMVSGLIDLLVTFTVFVGSVIVASVATANADEAIATVAAIGTAVGALVVLPTALETLTRGRTLGKMALGLRTVRDDGGPVTFQHTFVRALLGVVEIYAFSGVPAFFSALVSSRGKRLGDHAAGTTVVRDRTRLRLPLPTPMPPQLAAWAQSADVAPLPLPIALGLRQVLVRRDTLDGAARERLAVDLATRLQPYVSPPPPPGTPAEAYLAAVAATRRERDLARLHREAALRHRLVRPGSAEQPPGDQPGWSPGPPTRR